jgi:hypothetical protein
MYDRQVEIQGGAKQENIKAIRADLKPHGIWQLVGSW